MPSLYPAVTPSRFRNQATPPPPPPPPPPYAEASQPSLPAGWEDQMDQASQQIYNPASGLTSFEHPASVDTALASVLVASSAPAAAPSSDSRSAANGQCGVMRTPARNLFSAAMRNSGSSTGAEDVAEVTSLGQSANLAQRFVTSASTAIFGSISGHPVSDAKPRELAEHAVEAIGRTDDWQIVVYASTGPRPRPHETFGPFASQVAAEAHAKMIVPPRWEADSSSCLRCGKGFALLKRRTHCRNCGFTFCHSCCSLWPKASLPPSYTTSSDSSTVRVCAWCESSGARWRDALLKGELSTVVRAYDRGEANVNLCSPIVAQGQAQMLPVHCAAAVDSLPLLRWLTEEMHCSLQGVYTAGKTPKSVLRVAIERSSVDVLQWLLFADDAASHVGVPMPMPHETGCSAPALHRALEAAVREVARQRTLISLTLDQVGSASSSSSPQAAARERSNSGVGENECVVCLAAPADHVLVPCGHNCVCEDCCGVITSCPMCRASIEKAVRIFTS